MLTPLLFILVLTVISFIVNYKWKKRHYIEAINKFNGPPTLPIIGNVFDLLGSPRGEYSAFNFKILLF